MTKTNKYSKKNNAEYFERFNKEAAGTARVAGTVTGASAVVAKRSIDITATVVSHAVNLTALATRKIPVVGGFFLGLSEGSELVDRSFIGEVSRKLSARELESYSELAKFKASTVKKFAK